MFVRTLIKNSIRVPFHKGNYLRSRQLEDQGDKNHNSEPVGRQNGVERLRKRSMTEIKAEEAGYKKRILYGQ